MQATLANIEEARPFEDLTVCPFHTSSFPVVYLYPLFLQVEEVGNAHPRITEAVENMLKKGKWTVPGMSLCGVSLVVAAHVYYLSQVTRRSSATFRSCKWSILSLPNRLSIHFLIDLNGNFGKLNTRAYGVFLA